MIGESRRTNAGEPGLWETFGVLTPYLQRPGLTDLFVTADGGLWCDGAPEGLARIEDWSADEATVRGLAVQLIARGGRHIDEATPFVDVRLRDGVRVHAVLRKHPSQRDDCRMRKLCSGTWLPSGLRPRTRAQWSGCCAFPSLSRPTLSSAAS
ncbi:hypothetical protein [Leifsonia aquatica]|uniref:hypothetical protein n=1 Tax=Leifsonia aquatica TaxID=144185 RepID=UPI0019631CA3|nr:hypothetical protein [Leifsonia aquatica]